MREKYRNKDNSTISFGLALVLHLYWGAVAFFIYKMLLFIPITNISSKRSMVMLIGYLVAATCLGIAFRMERNLTSFSVAVDIMVGFGIYSVVAYGPYYRKWFLTIAYIAAATLLVYVVRLFSKRVNGRRWSRLKDRDLKKFVLEKRFYRTMDTAVMLLGISLVVMMVPVVSKRMSGEGIMTAETSIMGISIPEASDENADWTIEANIDTIEKIRENARWHKLTPQEKLAVLQVICNCEEWSMGLNKHVTVVADKLDEHVNGSYNNREHTIKIDMDHLMYDDAYNVLNTCLHEMYHAWQHCLIELYAIVPSENRKMRIFDSCEQYIREIRNYQNSTDSMESYMKYYNQKLEEDSRYYAETTTQRYCYKIDELQGNKRYLGLNLDAGSVRKEY